MLQKNTKKKERKELVDYAGTPIFSLAYLKEALEFEKDSGIFMKKLMDENKSKWSSERIDIVNKIVEEHRKNYKRILKQIERL